MPEPAAAGELEITPILKPLEPFQQQMTVIGNLSRAGGKTVTDHAVSSAGWLSGAVAKQTEAEDIRVGITIDQVLAKQHRPGHAVPVARVRDRGLLGLRRRLRAGLQLHLHEHDLVGGRDRAAADGDQPARRVRADVRPRRRRRTQRAARMRENRSILDSVADEARAAAARGRRAGSRAASTTTWTTCARSSGASSGPRRERRRRRPLAAPVGIPESFEEHTALMFDLLAVAYQADLTRVFTFMMAREASQRTYPGARHRETHHDVSHHGSQPDKMAQHAKINTHFTALFAAFVEKLRQSPDGDGSVLDHSLIVFGTGMSDGQAHNAYPLPLAAVGGAGGSMKGNRFVVAPEWTPIANLWLERRRPVRQPASSSSARARAASSSDRCETRALRGLAIASAVAFVAAAVRRRLSPARRSRRSSTRSSRATRPPSARLQQKRGRRTPPKPTAPRRCTGPCAPTTIELVAPAARAPAPTRRRRTATA